MVYRLVLVPCFLLAAGLAACGPGPKKELTPVTLQLQWRHGSTLDIGQVYTRRFLAGRRCRKGHS